jgi:hypothetical protein
MASIKEKHKVAAEAAASKRMEAPAPIIGPDPQAELSRAVTAAAGELGGEVAGYRRVLGYLVREATLRQAVIVAQAQRSCVEGGGANPKEEVATLVALANLCNTMDFALTKDERNAEPDTGFNWDL